MPENWPLFDFENSRLPLKKYLFFAEIDTRMVCAFYKNNIMSEFWWITNARHTLRDFTESRGTMKTSIRLVNRGPGPCLTTAIWCCRKPFSQWQRSFQRKLRSHWLKFLWQRHVAVVRQGPVLCILCATNCNVCSKPYFNQCQPPSTSCMAAVRQNELKLVKY